MIRYGSASVIATLSALFIACGPSPDRAARQQEAPKPKVGLLMDTLQEERWQRDRDLFLERAKQLGAEVLVESAERDDAKQLEQAESLLGRGVQVLVVVPHSAEAAGRIVEAAKKRSVPVISYDRLILNADVDLYTSYDNRMIGEQQAQYLRNRAPTGSYILLGGAPTDHNAKLIREGQQAALADAVKRGEIKIVAEPWTPDWQADAATTLTEAALKKAGNKVVAVVASNDITAGGAIKALEKHGLAGKVFVSGQDANLDAVRRIVNGTQTMTVYKPIRPLARGAAAAAVQLAKGEKVEGTSTVNNGLKPVQALLFTPIAVHKDLIDQVIINDKFHTREQVYGTAGRK
ncbi:MAG: substrate-binding domain-containing protein [Acidobacteria bacterium]|nr:substrate-binding domain-containing protein [Acidobacteriota bacterium]MCA1649009.1 substrate-binding domain-containing protein [Acidobacteriota bacterium]